MYGNFEHLTNLQYKVKGLEHRVTEFESGAKYRKMRSLHRKQLGEKDHEITMLKQELTDAHGETSTVRKYWQQGVEDLEREHAVALRKMERRLKKTEGRALSAERSRDEFHDKLLEKTRECYSIGTELEEEKGKNRKLLAQLNITDILNPMLWIAACMIALSAAAALLYIYSRRRKQALYRSV
jgi:hypothetical protein